MSWKCKVFYLFIMILLPVSTGWSAHGLSLDGSLKYPPDFKGFDYTSAQAKVGGTLVLHDLGSFDKMNPYTLKGMAPALLESMLFETLTTSSLDEPFSRYGLLADDIIVAQDGLSVTYHIRESARFSDGSPVGAEDVKFSLETLQSEKAHPIYRNYWRDITSTDIIDPHTIRFNFSKKNRELAIITGEIPIFSKAYFTSHPFADAGMQVPVGSGPYLVEKFDIGKGITYKRRSDYWGERLAVRRGFNNYERIKIKYFKDPVVAMEAFKAGEFDFIYVNNSKQWARDYKGEKFDNGSLVKEILAHRNGQGMQGFIFNMRRPQFQDIRVRKAMALAFDFEWSNNNLFYGQYTRSASYFSNSDLAAKGVPSPAEMALLTPFREQLDPSVFTPPAPPPSTKPPGSIRKNLRKAMKLLKEAGWRIGKDRKLVDKTGKPFVVNMMLVSPAFERILAPYAANLKRLGITLNYRTVDMTLYQSRAKSFDFDFMVAVMPQSQSPGNEQRNMWHSSSADQEGSRNYIGIKDPVVDHLVDKIIYAGSRKDLEAACKALDRVLLAGHYVIPNWHIPTHRIAYHNRFERPKTIPLYYSPTDWLLAWWIK